MTRLLRLALSVTLLALAGCASVVYEPVMVDSPMPAGFDKLPACGAGLEPGKSCLVLVRAGNWHSDTGISVEPGQVYRFDVPLGQVWFDKGRRNSPPHGEPGNFVMNMRAWAKRHCEPWFTLMAGIAPAADSAPGPSGAMPPAKAILHSDVLQSESLAKNCALVARAAGVLVLYPNDARGPTGRPDHFYANNSGQIWVKVTRLDMSQACPVATPR
jgi:hypothetical protein